MVLKKNLVLIFICSLLAVAGPLTGRSAAMEYDHKIEAEQISFEWTVDGEVIHIRLGAATTGWVGIGFNPSEKMKDANFVLGYVKKGKVKVTDHYGTSTKQHKLDTKLGGKSDIANAAGSEENGRTVVSFTIPLDSGDARDQAIAADRENIVLLAYSQGRDSFKTRHKFRTALRVDLNSGAFTKLK